MSATPVAASADEERRAEAQRRAEEVYDRVIAPVVRPEDSGKFVAVAFEFDDFEIDADLCAVHERLHARRPGAQVWLMRTGKKVVFDFRRRGGRP